MRTIRKRQPPTSLRQHSQSPHSDYANYADKQGLRESLVAEQRSLCCYCMSRITADEKKMRIEHWQPISTAPERQLDYPNLLGACCGNEGSPQGQQHCDVHKRDAPLSRNPANPDHHIEDIITFDLQGIITSRDERFNSEIDRVLNLNVPFLKNNRKAALDGFLQSLPIGVGARRDLLERRLAQWQGAASTGELEPFCQVVAYWITKKLAQ